MSFDFEDLQVRDLSRNFGRRRALTHLTLTCRAGEIVGLLGPNGAGKSTFLSIVGTLLAPSSGQVLYGGRTADQAGAALRGRIGVLAHDLHLYPELTARENLVFFAKLYGLADVETTVDHALSRANLADRGHDVVTSFSRGMRQRLALERSLIHRPRLLLLDEPFTGLDQTSTATLVGRLKELRDRGCLVICATHDLEVADGLLDRAAFLRDGKLVDIDAGGATLRERYVRAIAGHRG